MSTTSTTPRTSRPRWVVLGLLVLLAGGVAVALVLFLGGDEPEQVDAERALQQDQEAATTDNGAEEATLEEGEVGSETGELLGEDVGELGDEPEEVGSPAQPEDLDGRWIVDRSREFDREEGRGTFAGYRIQEELAGVGNTTAVGRTPEVDGEVQFDGTAVIAATIEADLTALVSDESRRDSRVRQELGDPANATFELDEQIDLPEVPPVGEVIELTATGTLTITGTTNEVEVDLQAVVTDVGLVIAGSTVIELDEYDVQVPEATILLSVSDQATIEWQLFLTRA